MNINLHLTGELAAYIDSLIKRGFAASKTEAARMMLVQQYQQQKAVPMDPIADEWQRAAAKAVWDNPADNKAEEFYIKKYLGGKKPK
jgi:Arc/MetJ-type ribon-helix-helix transcriptional regulator